MTEGKKKIELVGGVEDSNPFFYMYDNKLNCRLAIEVTPNSSAVSLIDEKGKIKALLMAAKDNNKESTYLRLVGKIPGKGFNAFDSKCRIEILARANEAHISAVGPLKAGCGSGILNGKSYLLLTNKHGKPISQK